MRVEERTGFHGVVSGTGLVLFGLVAASVLNLAFQVAIARHLPVDDVGRFFEATALAGITVNLCAGGLRAGLVRYVSILEPREGAALARKLVALDLAAALGVSAVIWLLVPVLASDLLHDRAAENVLRVVVAGVPFGVVGTLWAAAARGRKAFVYHVLGDSIGPPAVRLTFVLAGFALGFRLAAAGTAYAAGFAASALIGVVASRRLRFVGAPHGKVRLGRIKESVRFSAYRWAIDVLQVVLLWADTLILGVFYPPRVAGIYSVSSRVVVFLTVGLSALNLVVAPYAATALAGREPGALSRAFAVAARWAAILAIPPLALALILRTQILGLFGSEFAKGATPLAILVAGFAFNAACGPCGVLLTMSALNRLVLWDNVLAVAANLALNLVMVPPWGMVGAAIAWSSALILVNILMLLQIHRRLGVVLPQRPQVLTALGLAAVTGAAGFAATIGPGWGVAVAVAGFPAAIWMTRVPEEAALVRRFLAFATRSSPEEPG